MTKGSEKPAEGISQELCFKHPPRPGRRKRFLFNGEGVVQIPGMERVNVKIETR